MADSMDKTGHFHTCMACGKTWRCPSPAVCGANAKVLPSVILDGPDGPQVFDHVCRRQPAPKSETSTLDLKIKSEAMNMVLSVVSAKAGVDTETLMSMLKEAEEELRAKRWLS